MLNIFGLKDEAQKMGATCSCFQEVEPKVLLKCWWNRSCWSTETLCKQKLLVNMLVKLTPRVYIITVEHFNLFLSLTVIFLTPHGFCAGTKFIFFIVAISSNFNNREKENRPEMFIMFRATWNLIFFNLFLLKISLMKKWKQKSFDICLKKFSILAFTNFTCQFQQIIWISKSIDHWLLVPPFRTYS